MFNTHHLMVVKNTLSKFKPCLNFEIAAFERHKNVINKQRQHDEACLGAFQGWICSHVETTWMSCWCKVVTANASCTLLNPSENFHAASLLLDPASCACVPCLLCQGMHSDVFVMQVMHSAIYRIYSMFLTFFIDPLSMPRFPGALACGLMPRCARQIEVWFGMIQSCVWSNLYLSISISIFISRYINK